MWSAPMLANSSSSSRSRFDNFWGTATCSVAYRLPRAAPRTVGIPRPGKRQVEPFCVAAAIWTSTGAVERIDGDRPAERGLRERDRDVRVEVVAIAPEARVRRDLQVDVEVARGPAARPDLAVAGEADAAAVVDAGREPYRHRALPLDAATAAAGATG